MLSRVRISAPHVRAPRPRRDDRLLLRDAIHDDGQEAPDGEAEERGGHGSDQGVHVGGRS